MYALRRFHGARFDRVNAIIDSLEGHITSFVNLVGSAILPFPEVCAMEGLPATACRAEGHFGARYFPATDPLDLAEAFISERVRALFGCGDDYEISAQPHSATQANHAVFRAVLGQEGHAVAALRPVDGGHVSHQLGLPAGSQLIPFTLTASGIDYDATERDVLRSQPAMIIAGGTSYTRAIDFLKLREIADLVGAHLHADLAHNASFVASGHHPPVFPYADSVALDCGKNLRGPRGGILVYRRGMTSAAVKRAIFPVLQTSPNQAAVFAKAACLARWSEDELAEFCDSMIRLARLIGRRLERHLGPSSFGESENHLLLFDVSPLGIDGRQAEERLEQARILVNRNQVPGDALPPWAPSGIRLGTAQLAILGYTSDDAELLGDAIVGALTGRGETTETINRLLEVYHRPLVSTSSEGWSSASNERRGLMPRREGGR